MLDNRKQLLKISFAGAISFQAMKLINLKSRFKIITYF
jgi:hypothetical protein